MLGNIDVQIALQSHASIVCHNRSRDGLLGCHSVCLLSQPLPGTVTLEVELALLTQSKSHESSRGRVTDPCSCSFRPECSDQAIARTVRLDWITRLFLQIGEVDMMLSNPYLCLLESLQIGK